MAGTAGCAGVLADGRNCGPAVEAQPPDAAVVGDLVQLMLLDLRAQVRPARRPLRFLDDAVVHVGDVDRAVRPQLQVDRAEQRIGPEDELRSGIDVSELREPIGLDDLRATDQASDRLGEEQITAHVLRIAVGPHDLRAGGRGEVVQRAERLTDAAHASLHVADARRRPHGIESRLEAIVEGQRTVLNRKLEVDRPALGAGVDEPHLAVVVLRSSPTTRRSAPSAHAGCRRASSGSGTSCRCCRSSCRGPR